MKRYNVIKYFLELINEHDVCIFSGQELCKEAYVYDRPGNFYIEDTFGVVVSFALGVAMCSKKKVFVFVGEGELLRDLSSVVQAAVSNCQNIIIVVLDNGVYLESGGQPNIFSGIVSKRGLFYDMGFLVQDYTKHFNDMRLKQLKSLVDRLSGPAIILVELSKGINKKIEPLVSDKMSSKTELMKFLSKIPQDNKSLMSEDTRSLNLDEVGGIN